MLLSHIQHYLTPEGIKFFPTWYTELKQLFLKQDGFISIKCAVDPSDVNCMHIWTEFTNLEKAEQWAKTKTRDDIQARLDPYRTKPQLIKRYHLLDY